MRIREEEVSDLPGIREVNRAAFGQDVEALLVDRLREQGLAVASLVAVEEGRVVGHVLFSDLSIDTTEGTLRAAALAPVAVRPERQGRGIGSALIRRGLELCREGGRSIVVVVGDPAYYRRFGFSSEAAANLRAPFSGEAFMAMELVPGSLAGVAGTVKYPDAFGLVEESEPEPGVV